MDPLDALLFFVYVGWGLILMNPLPVILFLALLVFIAWAIGKRVD